MISEGSCYTEDWSNDAENSAFLQQNKLHHVKYIILITSYSYCYFMLFANELLLNIFKQTFAEQSLIELKV